MTTDDLLRTAMTVDDELDDIKRAQLWARLEPRLADAEPRSRVRWPVAVAVGFAAAAIAVVVAVEGGRVAPASYVAPRDTTLSLHVDDRTRAVLVGPAQLDAIAQSATTTVVRLRSGTLLAEFEGGHGRSLHILAPGAVVEIVGTLFAVEARRDATCVSVSHGTVKMTSAGRVQVIESGERACSDEVAAAPIDPAVREALARQATQAIAAVAPVPVPVPIAPPPPPAIVSPPAIATPPRAHVATPPRASGRTPTAAHAPVVARVESVSPSEPAPAAPAATTTPPTLPLPSSTPAPVDAPTIPPPPSPPVVRRPPDDADALYTRAERDLAGRDVASADRDLARLIDEFPASSLVDQAYYERARIAFDRHAWAAAQRYLDRLAQLPASPLAEPGAYLACRIAVEAHDGAAADCFADYRTRYPRSPHDRDVLGAIAELAFRAGGCARARRYLDELAKRYPASARAAHWSATCR